MNGGSMTHATLFSGIGAPELAATWMGWQNLFTCEINPLFVEEMMGFPPGYLASPFQSGARKP